MKTERESKIGRREWLAGTVPACAALCVAPCKALSGNVLGSGSDPQEGPNPFDQELKRPITYRDLMRTRYGNDYIPIMKALGEQIGEEALLEMIKEASYAGNRAAGERMAARVPETSLRNLTMAFRNPNPDGVFANSNTWEIVEDTEDAFEIRITACLAADVFLENAAADLGYATVCHADFGLPEGFNPALRLERDKTIMQGHGYCNHRFVRT